MMDFNILIKIRYKKILGINVCYRIHFSVCCIGDDKINPFKIFSLFTFQRSMKEQKIDELYLFKYKISCELLSKWKEWTSTVWPEGC